MESIIKLESFIKWIQEQPDDRPVDMTFYYTPCNKNSNDCGCLMMEYVRDRLNPEGEISCGFERINVRNPSEKNLVISMDFHILEVCPIAGSIKTFKDVKGFIKDKKF